MNAVVLNRCVSEHLKVRPTRKSVGLGPTLCSSVQSSRARRITTNTRRYPIYTIRRKAAVLTVECLGSLSLRPSEERHCHERGPQGCICPKRNVAFRRSVQQRPPVAANSTSGRVNAAFRGQCQDAPGARRYNIYGLCYKAPS